MIGHLPQELNINDAKRAIRTDFRTALLIFQAFNDVELSDREKAEVMLKCLYEDFDNIACSDYQEAVEKAAWFLDGGKEYEEAKDNKKVLDWEQDEQLIFPAINKAAGYEVRAVEYLHWWTFIGFFNEIGEGLFSSVVSIRQKKNKGKKLEKYEQEFYKENKQLIEIERKYSAEEQAEIDYLNKLLG